MAFNFNWSPLIADTSRARDMLTNALNKTPKPPIIVDDIIVTELNLGSVPPELEILEIGDLAEDRFRGIFKMSYTGDAYLTLKTRVQANPLNTYLSTKPAFASPQPLAASSGLTIPLQITLSDIRMSGFVILVFSRQKGITLVFRNDPLESLKVSSTFDSIPFVRDYLQKEIEGQLRVLFMDDLPAIIHRLSLRMCTPDYQNQEDDTARARTEKETESPIDPLSSPPQNPLYDTFLGPLEQVDLAYLSSPDATHQTHATFSRKNLLRLATLTDSHRTLSLFTPPIRDAVFRAWAGAAERGDITNLTPLGLGHGFGQGLTQSALSRANSTTTSREGSVYSFSETASNSAHLSGSASARPTLSTMTSAYSFASNGSARQSGRPNRKRKHRIVNLRKPKPEEEQQAGDGADERHDSVHPSRPSTPTSTSASHSASEPREGEILTPPDSPERLQKTPRARPQDSPIAPMAPMLAELHSPRPRPTSSSSSRHFEHHQALSRSEQPRNVGLAREMHEEPSHMSLPHRPLETAFNLNQPPPHTPTKSRRPRHLREQRTQSLPPDQLPMSKPAPSAPNPNAQPPSASGGILEQAWMMKMATEIARKVREEKEKEAAEGREPNFSPVRTPGKGRSGDFTPGGFRDHDLDDPEATIRPVRHKMVWNADEDDAAEGGSLEFPGLEKQASPPPAYAA